MHRLNPAIVFKLIVPVFLILLPPLIVFGQGPRVIEILATKDNSFRASGQKGNPIFTLKAGEVVKLRFNAQKGTEWEKDGTAHSFTVQEFKDEGWNVRLQPGIKEVTLVVPDRPGEYKVECTVKCGTGHDDMAAKIIIEP